MSDNNIHDSLGTCCSGIDALKCFELLTELVPEEKMDARLQMLCNKSYNRMRYEVAKGYGVPKKVNKGVKAWHKDFYTCGHCGATAGEANHEYCPNCGTRYLKNSYTEQLLEQNEFDPGSVIDEYEAKLYPKYEPEKTKMQPYSETE